MPQKGYKSVTLPEDLLNRVELFIGRYPESGMRSVTEFVVDAIRRRIEELEEIEMRKRELDSISSIGEAKKKYST